MRYLLIGIFALLLFFSCRKDEQLSYQPDLRLSFSIDTVMFDTVFTSAGSTTRRFKIFNFNNRALKLNQMSLGGGSNSPFAVNINGQPLLVGNSLVIDGNDSVNVLVKVNINPNLQNQPFIVRDSLVFLYNGNRQVIPLVAYGQNAIFLDDFTITQNTNWDSPLPYVIRKKVTVAEHANLNIAAGARIYFHRDAGMDIKGTLTALGTPNDSITFASDRTERIYQEEPGQWRGLRFFASSQSSIIEHSTIKNAIYGLQVDSLTANLQPKLILANSIVKNMQVAAIQAKQSHIKLYNNLIYNCGQYLLYAEGGGEYEALQNTFAAYNFNFSRRYPAIYLSDYSSNNQYAALSVNFVNNIVWGSLDNELKLEQKSNTPIQLTLNYNLLKSNEANIGTGNVYNVDPLFTNARQGNYSLMANTPAANKGADLTGHPYFIQYLQRDLQSKPRQFPSDLGCFELD